MCATSVYPGPILLRPYTPQTRDSLLDVVDDILSANETILEETSETSDTSDKYMAATTGPLQCITLSDCSFDTYCTYFLHLCLLSFMYICVCYSVVLLARSQNCSSV